MWRHFDAGEIRADFQQMVGLGLDTVRFFVRWDEFQPQRGALDATMVTRLATLVGLAHDVGLGVVPTLFCGYQAGVAFLPEWALDRARPAGPVRTVVGERLAPYACGNLYAEPLLAEQLRFARTVGEALRDHPAIAAWDIGHRFSDVREPRRGTISAGDHGRVPAAEREVAAWSARLCETLRASSGHATTAGTHADDLTRDRHLRFDSLCLPFAFASMQGTTLDVPCRQSRLDPEAIPFLAMLTASFSHRPVLLTGLGATYMTEDEQAAYGTQVLERLHADGRLGAYWYCWSDYAERLAQTPPFDEAPQERTAGIVRADGSLKPLASALARFAERKLTVVPARDMPMISSTYFYRTLPTSLTTLYAAYLEFVAERRRGA
jgi:hypothetical protein